MSFVVTEPGHRLNHTGSCSPQLMEDMAGEFHYGAVIRTSDGGVTAFKQARPPADGATEIEIQAFADSRLDGTDVVATFDIGLIPFNPLWLPVNTWDGLPDGIDDHFAIAVGVDYLDRVWVSGNSREDFVSDLHSGSLHWTRYDPALGDFDDVASWQIPAYPAVFAACGLNAGHTYQHYRRLSDGTLLFFTSQIDTVDRSRGRDFLAFYLNEDTAGAWMPLITTRLTGGDDKHVNGTAAPNPVGGGHFAQCSGVANANVFNDVALFAGPANRVYANNIHVEKLSPTVDRLHVAGIWRTADSDGRSSHSPYYIYCDNPVENSGGWKTITGAAQVMPIAWTATNDNRAPSATILPAAEGFIQQGQSISIAIDGDGFPHFVFENGSSGNPNIWKPDTTIPKYAESVRTNSLGGKQAIMHVWWDGVAWQKKGIDTDRLGVTSGPTIFYVNGVGYLMSAPGNWHNRIYSDWADADTNEFIILGSAFSGAEVNPDPVSLTQRGELAVMVPLIDDVPKVYWFGQNRNAVVNEAANNTTGL